MKLLILFALLFGNDPIVVKSSASASAVIVSPVKCDSTAKTSDTIKGRFVIKVKHVE